MFNYLLFEVENMSKLMKKGLTHLKLVIFFDILMV